MTKHTHISSYIQSYIYECKFRKKQKEKYGTRNYEGMAKIVEREDPEIISSHQFSSVAQSCPLLCDPMGCSTPGFPVHHQLPELSKFMSTELVMPYNHLILCCPRLLPPSIIPSIRAFSTELVLHIRWPKYWSFSFSISPSNEYSGLTSFRMNWLDLLSGAHQNYKYLRAIIYKNNLKTTREDFA